MCDKPLQYDADSVLAGGGRASAGAHVAVTRQQLATLQKYYAAVRQAYLEFGQSDGDAELVVRRLFDRTSEVLRLPAGNGRSGESPLAAAIARRRWKAAAHLVALRRQQLADREPRDLLAMAAGADPPADAGLLRCLTRQWAAARSCSGGAGANYFHAAASAPTADALDIVLDELRSMLDADDHPDGQRLRDGLTKALTSVDIGGSTPIHLMARGNRAGALLALLDAAQRHGLRLGWDARQTGGRGLTPLVLAAEAGALEACELLLSRGLASADAATGGQRDLWLRAAPTEAARRLLARHCRRREDRRLLLKPLADLPEAARQRLLDGLRARGLEEAFAADLRARCCPCLPPQTAGAGGGVLDRLDSFVGLARLAVWDALGHLGLGDLAELLEGPSGTDDEDDRKLG